MASTELLAILLLSAFSVISVVESSCPDSDKISPCYCEETHDKTVLRCVEIPHTHVRKLVEAAENSDGYRYDEVYIQGSTLPYIPRVVLENIQVRSLILSDLTLTQLFDDIPYTQNDLYRLYLHNIKFENDMSFDAFKYTKSLQYLNFSHISIHEIPTKVNEFVTHDLKELIFEHTDTRSIQRDALKDFRSLDRLVVSDNRLETIHRDFLPKPFNGTTLDFRNNILRDVPENIFTEMPHLTTVYFNGNLIPHISEPPEESKLFSLDRIDLSGNPIKCDCHLNWIPVLKMKNIVGICEAPKTLRGKPLKYLTEDDFDC